MQKGSIIRLQNAVAQLLYKIVSGLIPHSAKEQGMAGSPAQADRFGTSALAQQFVFHNRAHTIS